MSNFAFLPSLFGEIAQAAAQAERNLEDDPRGACFHARFGLEAVVHWLYRHDPRLAMPYDTRLGTLIHEPSFTNLLPQTLFHKARLILKIGNRAVHSAQPVTSGEALQAVKELFHLCYWMVRTYTPEALWEGTTWKDEHVSPQACRAEEPLKEKLLSRKEMEALEEERERESREKLALQQERDALDSELQALKEELARVRARMEQTPDLHDYSEAETRHYLIDQDLRRAGWLLNRQEDREYLLEGMPTSSGTGYADYVLWGDDGKPLGVVEAKRTTADAVKGRQQAKLYADCLEKMHDQRPVIFYTNGYDIWMWDDGEYSPRKVEGFYSKEDLARLVLRRKQRCPLTVEDVRESIVDRHYQKRVLRSVLQHFSQARRKALLVMATGTGKTRTAIALVDVLQRAGWVKRTLFLADRVALVKQAATAFKKHLPDATTVNLVTEKDTSGQIFVCTYPTMMGLLEDEGSGHIPRFGVGYFDLVIIDEAHRSVYQKYGALFRYFDSLLVGLTATPREELDKNTYELFDLETGVPTDAYELDSAVRDGYLVPYGVTAVDLKFPREGIRYEDLSPEEQARWESLDWGEGESEALPEHVNPSALNAWLFNEDTVDKVLQCLMERGHTMEGGDRLAKTILFARNHKHAVFIEERFNHHYPHYAGHFARVVDNYASYAQSLIDDFSQKDKAPHLAISVDMLDTGIDVPEVANLVFFKPVYSRIKFWQMIGRGTRLCPDLFGPGKDKRDFYIFDFCGNFEFFREHPRGVEASGTPSLNTRLFQYRVRLLGGLQDASRKEGGESLHAALGDMLHRRVSAMPVQNFQVRPFRREVERFANRRAWDSLGVEDRHLLATQLASLPSSEEEEDERIRRFDLKALSMQLGLLEGDASRFEMYRRQVVTLAGLLEEKKTVPPVAAQLAYLARLQETEFWEHISLEDLEDMRLRLRGLTVFLDTSSRSVVYTDFEDAILDIRRETPDIFPGMTGEQYAKKVAAYLASHRDDLVIHKLHTNRPLTAKDLESLEETLVRIGEEEGKMLLSGLLARSGAPSLVHFVRSLVGLDRGAAQELFSSFLSDHSLSTGQIRFIELIIDQLTARGVMDSSALYESPFSDLHAGGPEGLFAGKEQVMEDIFSTLSTTAPRVLGEAG